MASRIKGIIVEIGGDTTKLTDALRDVNNEVQATRDKLAVQYFDTESAELKSTEVYVEGFQAKLKKDTSYRGLWTVSFVLKEF